MYDKTVGIYMPTHNRVELLKRAVNSILQQSYQNFKLVIVNDGSSDNTQEYLESLDDPRISYMEHQVPQGACCSRNKAISLLNTELVTGLDDDDVFLPNRLEDLLSVYNDKYSFVCSGYYWDYGAHKKSLFNKEKLVTLSDAFDLNQCSNQILVKRERILSVGSFDENLPALQDHDLWVRLIAEYGSAYRTGKLSYIVNDDHSLDRISSIDNKLNAISIFEKKHASIMTERNKENFLFYKAKICGDKYLFKDFIKSTKYGLVGIKIRQYLSQYFPQVSKLRLLYLQTGSVSKIPLSEDWLVQRFIPLLATGGPGASRVILLSACIYFFGAGESSSFSGDFFIIMLLNTAFSQSYGFFLLKPEYSQSFVSVTKQSIKALFISTMSVFFLFKAGLIGELLYSLVLIIVLHFYYLYRFKYISKQYFFPLALAEVLISICCLFLPLILSSFDRTGFLAPYQIYSMALFIGLVTIISFSVTEVQPRKKLIPFKKIRNISISTTASIFAVFTLPAAIKTIAAPEIVSIVALTISCMSISMLIPRTYANKIMTHIAGVGLQSTEFYKIGAYYRKLMLISSAVGLFLTIGYLHIIEPQVGSMAILAPLGISAILMSAQLGFVSLTYLSLQGADQYVAKMNLIVLLITGLFTIPIFLGWIDTQFLIYIIVVVACVSFLLRNTLAVNKAHVFLNKK